MTQEEFLDENVFKTGPSTILNDDKSTLYFAEGSFSEILNKAEHYGISVYDIKSNFNGEAGKTIHHEEFRKKATDPDWYKKQFKALKREQAGYLYAGTFKVSKKLLNRK